MDQTYWSWKADSILIQLWSWNSNSSKFQEIAYKEKSLDKDELTTILDIQWNAKTDKLLYQGNSFEIDEKQLAKRYILQQSSKKCDPLVLLSPVTVKAKIFK